MKINEKWMLFIVATIVTFFGITNYLMKGTKALDEVPANDAFEDINFYKCVVDNYNRDNGTSIDYSVSLSDEELAMITKLNCYGYDKEDEEKVTNTKGLEKLANLTELILTDNLLTKIDLTSNVNLEDLYLTGNQLSTLDISKNVLLKVLDVGYWSYTSLSYKHNSRKGNQLTELDVSKNTMLTKLYVSSNQLTELDVSENVLLKELVAPNSQLTKLNVSGAVSLTSLEVYGTQLTELDVSKNIALTKLYAPYNKLTKLNVSGAIALTSLELMNNQLTELDVNKNSSLTYLNADNNQLTELDVSQNTALTKLYASYNKLTKLNVSQNTALTSLELINNQLAELDVNENSSLTYLNTHGNQLTKLNVSKNTALTYLGVVDNQLTELDVSKNIALTRLYASNNQLTELDVSKNTALTDLDASNNQLTELDVSKNTALTDLDASNNQLTELDVSKNTALTDLDASNNQLIELNVSGAIALTELYAYNNQLTELDVSKNIALTKLYASNNQLIELDVSQNTALTSLSVYNNQLTELDVSQNTALEYLDAHNNQLTGLDLSSNTKLKSVKINNNSYSEKIYVYKNGIVVTGKNVNIPDYLDWDEPTWTSDDTSIVAVDSDNIVTALDTGTVNVVGKNNEYTTTSTIIVVEITSDKYSIGKDYIYVGSDTDKETIESNISKSDENITIDIDSENYKLYVKYGEEVLKEFSIVSYSSSEYDLSKDYIYVGTDQFNKNDINTINCDTAVENNKLLIKYGVVVLDEYKIVSISSQDYDLSKEYIYIGSKELVLNNIDVINGSKKVENNQLLIKYDDTLLEQFDIVSIKFTGYDVYKNNIVIDKNVIYENFISDIVASDGITYKLFDGEEEVTTGSISIDMKLEVYYDGNEIDEYLMIDEYFEFDSSLKVDGDNALVSDIKVNTEIDELFGKIYTSGTITGLDKNDNEIVNGSKLKTGDRFRVTLPSQTFIYTISVNGDINGDGIVDIEDARQASKHVIKGNMIIGAEYLKASDVDKNDKIDINDIIRLARHINDGTGL